VRRELSTIRAEKRIRNLWELHKEYMQLRQAARSAMLQIEHELRERSFPIFQLRRKVILGEEIDSSVINDEVDASVDETLMDLLKDQNLNLENFWADVITTLLDGHTPNKHDAELLKYLVDVRLRSKIDTEAVPMKTELLLEFEFSEEAVKTKKLDQNILKATYLYELDDIQKCYDVIGLPNLQISPATFSIFELFQHVESWDDVTEDDVSAVGVSDSVGILTRRQAVQTLLYTLKEGGVGQALDVFFSQNLHQQQNINDFNSSLTRDNYDSDDEEEMQMLTNRIERSVKKSHSLISSSPQHPNPSAKRPKKKKRK